MQTQALLIVTVAGVKANALRLLTKADLSAVWLFVSHSEMTSKASGLALTVLGACTATHDVDSYVMLLICTRYIRYINVLNMSLDVMYTL